MDIIVGVISDLSVVVNDVLLEHTVIFNNVIKGRYTR